MYKQGDIVSVKFPFTDLSSAKLRPALIVSNAIIDNTGDVVIVMITSQQREDGLNLPITENDIDVKLPKQSYVRCHRLATIDMGIVESKIGEITISFLNQIASEVKSIIDIETSQESAMAEFVASQL